MAFTFAVDTDLLDSVSKELETKITELKTTIDNIFKEINNMGTSGSWTGVVYDSFVDKTTKYKVILEELTTVIEAYKKLLDNVNDKSTGAHNLIEKVQKTIDDLVS